MRGTLRAMKGHFPKYRQNKVTPALHISEKQYIVKKIITASAGHKKPIKTDFSFKRLGSRKTKLWTETRFSSWEVGCYCGTHLWGHKRRRTSRISNGIIVTLKQHRNTKIGNLKNQIYRINSFTIMSFDKRSITKTQLFIYKILNIGAI